MPVDATDDVTVTYGVKELLAEIKNEQTAGFTDLAARLDSKADKADVAELRAGLGGHDRRLSEVEQALRDGTTVSEVKRSGRRSWREFTGWAVAAGIGLFAAVGTWVHHP